MNNEIFEKNIFDGKVAFVTGGGTGITGGVARALTEHGAKVAITSRKIENLEPMKKLIEDGGRRMFCGRRRRARLRSGFERSCSNGRTFRQN